MDDTELANSWRDIYSGQLQSSGGGVDWGSLGSSFGSAMTGIAQVYGAVEIAKAKSATPLYQYGPNGQLYREGMPVQGMQQAGGISPLMLLILAGVAIFALKD